MAVEIERKFLLLSDSWKSLADKGELYEQGYITKNKEKVVRVRLTSSSAYLTIKGAPAVKNGIVSASKAEFEYEIPQADAREMLNTLCVGPKISKRRYQISYKGFIWEIDLFYGENEGLVVAEIELEHEEQIFPKPPWLGIEVTSESRYYNAALAEHPYKNWP